MGAITIRRLDDEVIATLKAQAEAAGRSMEEEVRRILEHAASDALAASGRAGREAFVARLRKTHERHFGDAVQPSSLELLRKARNADPQTPDRS